MSPPQAKIKVAVLGGGVASMVAAWELTATPELRARYEVTVHQLGWRLGGKGASGRNLGADMGHRIEEHGLHIWMGFYENAFRVMRAAYAEWQQAPDAPLRRWDDAFKPHDLITLEEHVGNEWIHWPLEFPRVSGEPGVGQANHDGWLLAQRALGWLKAIFHDHLLTTTGSELPPERRPAKPNWIETLLGDATLEVIKIVEGSAIHRAVELASALGADSRQHSAADHARIAAELRGFRHWLWGLIEHEIERHTLTRRLWLLIDMGVSTMVGLLEEGVFTDPQGFDKIDTYEWREFMRKYGLTEANAWSAPVRAIYDLAFGYRDGLTDPEHADMGAGTTIRGMLRMVFGYQGAIFYKMQAGMGDTVFSPLYGVLRQRGVKFEFFHEVKQLQPGADGSTIDGIVIQRQATVKPEQVARGGYDPLIPVLGVQCWPSEPFYDQLVEGAAIQAGGYNLESRWSGWPGVGAPITLRRGVDFDQVVLGISMGALGEICAPLVAAHPRWQKMVDEVRTVRTQAVQLWLDRDAAALGWDAPERAVLGSYVEPLDTWADMSQLLVREDWPARCEPRNVAYFCGPKDETPPTPPAGDDPAFPRAALDLVKAQALQFLSQDIGHLWPKAVDANGVLDWNRLVDPNDGRGLERFEAQYFRVNVDPSERYVLSVKNSLYARLRADESGYANLVLAGDWTRNGLNVGCVECATLGGLTAARALLGGHQVFPGETDHAPA